MVLVNLSYVVEGDFDITDPDLFDVDFLLWEFGVEVGPVIVKRRNRREGGRRAISKAGRNGVGRHKDATMQERQLKGNIVAVDNDDDTYPARASDNAERGMGC